MAASRKPSVSIAFDHVALDLPRSQEFQSREFFTEADQIHQQLRCFRPACGECQPRRSIRFENEHSARPKTPDRLSVDSASNRGWQMGKDRDDSRPSTRFYFEGPKVRHHRLNLDATHPNESPCFCQTRVGLIYPP